MENTNEPDSTVAARWKWPSSQGRPCSMAFETASFVATVIW
jgi:hypothetical protein